MRRWATVVMLIVLGLLIGLLAWPVIALNIKADSKPGQTGGTQKGIPWTGSLKEPDMNSNGEQAGGIGLAQMKEPLNVLIVGLDTGEFPRGAVREGKGRTDTIILARLDPQKRLINMLSIPRDTLVEIPGRGSDKINHAHSFGDMSLVVQTVELFTGVEIDHYLKFDYRCFSELMEVLGGVNVQVTEELHHKYYDFYPGTVHMDPAQAFVYLRLRNVPGGDITRTGRQQRFCIDLAKEIQKPKNWIHIPRLCRVVARYGETNLSTLEVLKIANTFRGEGMDDITVNTVPGTDYMRCGVYYWKPDTGTTAVLVGSLFDTGQVSDK